MRHDLNSIFKDIVESQRPFEKIDELNVNENLKAFLRRKVLEDVYGISIPSISSTITDFAESKEYSLLKPLGSVEKPVGYLGSVRIKRGGKLIQPHLLVSWTLARYVSEIYDAIKVLGKQEIIATSQDLPSDSNRIIAVEKIFRDAKRTRVNLEIAFSFTSLNEDALNSSRIRWEPLLRVFNEIVLTEIYSLLGIPVVLAMLSYVEQVSFATMKDSLLQARFNVVMYLTQPFRSIFTEEVLRLFQVKEFEDLPVILSIYSLLAFLSLLIKDRIVLV